MYYRYEAKKNGEHVGIFAVLNPDQRRYFARFLKEPEWYKSNPGVDSRCWFTEYGYEKYHHIIDELIEESGNLEVRVVTKETLPNVVIRGKVQCIELVVNKELENAQQVEQENDLER